MNIGKDQLDFLHAIIDGAVFIASALTTFQNMKLRQEIMRLKLWIAQNFVAKDGANLLDDGS